MILHGNFLKFEQRSSIFELQELGVRIDYFVWQCFGGDSASLALTWLAVIYVYLAIWQLVGVVLAIQTRKVNIKVLNDAKFITAAIYISSVVFVVAIAVMFAVESYINLTEALFSGGLLVAMTAFVELNFIPKVSDSITYY